MLSSISQLFAILVLISTISCPKEAVSHQSAPYESQLLDCADSSELEQQCLNKISTNSSNNPSLKAPSLTGPNRDTNLHLNLNLSTSNGNQNHRRDTQFAPGGGADICPQSSSNESGTRPSLVCTQSDVTKDEKQLEVYIVGPQSSLPSPPPPSSSSSNESVGIPIGSSLTIQCRFNATLKRDLNFKLRWLRSVVSSQGHNQSITQSNNETFDSVSAPSVIVSASAARLWTVQRDGGLDLVLDEFGPNDSGDYFCQAVSSSDDRSDVEIFDEKRIRLSSAVSHNIVAPGQEQVTGPDIDDAGSSEDEFQLSQENLVELLPSLKVIPAFSQLAPGESVQLACVTSELDPDPDEGIEWSFEPLVRPGAPNYDYYVRSVGSAAPTGGADKYLPPNVSPMGNVLTIWSVSQEHCGVYRCSVSLADFNLTVQATGEVSLRPGSDSAPLVFIEPELLRLSANGSASIQCESTGFPVPSVDWYRVEAPATNGAPAGESVGQMEGVELELIGAQDAQAYCSHVGCVATHRRPANRPHHQVTSVSLVHIKRARAHHQGQYVCRASNKHGSNQASAIVDVEFKARPLVRISDKSRRQTIVLPADDGDQRQTGGAAKTQNVTFRCSVEAGRPRPRLRWLRSSAAIGKLLADSGPRSAESRLAGSPKLAPDLDIYDLTKVSSATAKVATWHEDGGKTLVLSISTISIDDEGDYVCLGDNELGVHSAVARLNVRRPAGVRILQTSPRVARLNESFQLDCLAAGHPAPMDIEWSRSDRGAFFALISRHTHGGTQERAVLKFDRVSSDEAGEYTCAARDPANPVAVLRDTIMLLVEDNSTNGLESMSVAERDSLSAARARQLPKLMVRPTKVSALVGANVTLDCLAISGLQPTIVEWLAPTALVDHQPDAPKGRPDTSIRPYYRSPLEGAGGADATSGRPPGPSSHLLQFGSKLRILNVSRAHEGIYQCKGRNKVGVENAPALVKVVDSLASDASLAGLAPVQADAMVDKYQQNATETMDTKTKVAKTGTNIELRCQVNGMDEQPATSWSRVGRELPATSVQIGHNLWIRKLTPNDEGLYLCSARSNEPNRIIQARINLLVRADSEDLLGRQFKHNQLANLSAKIVASKNNLNVGDSVTLECILSYANRSSPKASAHSALFEDSSESLDELERQVVWTNLHSGESLFQDNVYVQNNLLIIYDLKQENAAIYRCNYNDLTQYTDYKLQVVDSSLAGANSSADPPTAVRLHSAGQLAAWSSNGRRVHLKQVPAGSRLVLECQANDVNATIPAHYHWRRGSRASKRVGAHEAAPLVFESIEPSDADLYQCSGAKPDQPAANWSSVYLVQVQQTASKFVQRPASFVTLPAISGADHQLEIEMKFLPEKDHGLMLFSGALSQMIQQPAEGKPAGATRSQLAGAMSSGLANSDYISLGLNKGHLEFRFELGDGATLLRSQNSLTMNQWHRLLIERNRRGATMWLDGLAPVSNSSAGKFFNLNLDSVLFVGGHQVFLNNFNNNARRQQVVRLNGYSRGFQGCIGLLRVNGRELDLMARNRSASIGLFECDKLECRPNSDCSYPNGICQVDRKPVGVEDTLNGSQSARKSLQSRPNSDVRCICLPNFVGPNCNETANNFNDLDETSRSSGPHNSETQQNNDARASVAPGAGSQQQQGGACDIVNNCNPNGTIQCQSLTSTSFKCHCKLGYMGEACERVAQFTNETTIGFQQLAYLQLRFNTQQEYTKLLSQQQNGLASSQFAINSTNDFARLTSSIETQNISFRLQTRSSYGLIFYTGKAPADSMGSFDSQSTTAEQNYHLGNSAQPSKSVVANLLARLSGKVVDFLAIALVDGHVELSFELGSGSAIIRSSRRVNDDQSHLIQVIRQGKLARLTIDKTLKHEGSSPGRLSMLNGGDEIYLGGLPQLSANSTNGMLLSSFSGCISQLEINSLGPLNLIRNSPLARIESARNLVPCSVALSAPPPAPGDPIGPQLQTSTTTTTGSTTAPKYSSKRPAIYSQESEGDDLDDSE